MSARREALLAAAWPQARASQALVELARAAGLAPRGSTLHEIASDEGAATLSERLAATAEECDVELEAVETPYAGAAELVARGAPALLRLVHGDETRLLALLRGGPRPVLLDPNGARRRTTAEEVRALWCEPYEHALDPQVTPVLDASGMHGARRAKARAALIGEHLGAVPVGGAWILRLPPGRALSELARDARLGRLVLGIGVTGFAASLLALLSWIPLGRGVLSGRLEPAWLVAWALLLASALPLRWLEGWLQSLFGVRFAVLFRRRLMAGATRLDPNAMRGEGAGRLLARVLDSEALEALLVGGGFVLIGAALDVALATWVLSHGPAPWLSLALFALLLVVVGVLGARHARRAHAQADARLGMTHDLVERMHGQRTRVVQEPRERWHLEEDARLERYLVSSRRLDRSTLALLVVTGGGWLVLGAAALALAFVAGSVPTVQLALGIGAVLLGQGALARLGGGLVQLSACLVAWRQVRPIWEAAAAPVDPGLPREALRPAERAPADARRGTLVAARGLSFRHPGREEDVLAGADFAVAEGDAVLLEGPSGGGKSTLVSLLAGWRAPRAGSLLLDGLDRASHGAHRWRRAVAVAPQFHENHVFTGTLAFNCLLAAPAEPEPPPESPAGSFLAEPASVRAEERAREVCTELGLGDLLERMPSGMRQVVGETGWQLSHGEKSRVFLARALLADARLVVLDESLAALDPVTAREVLACVRRRAPAVLVVAHP